MKIISNNIEASLLETVKSIKGEVGNHYALHFHLSQLNEQYQSEFQLKIAVNVLNDIFRVEEGYIFVSRDADLFVIYYGDDRDLLDKAIFQLRYLFVDDLLANNRDGSENDDFCSMYDLTFQWRTFYRIAMERMNDIAHVETSVSIKAATSKDGSLTAHQLVEVERELDTVNLGFALRKQPVCAIRPGKKSVKTVYHEMYINISHLRRLFSTDYNITSHKWLFKYLTEILDEHMLELLGERPSFYMAKPISLNLNIKTVLSDEFRQFHMRIEEIVKSSLIIEIDIADVFADMPAFTAARDIAQELGCRICIDGLNNKSFVQVDRESLGFDLAKLQWNADLAGDLGSRENLHLTSVIERCGSNRMILCRCDSKHAIEYGHALGISLFQGRYPDRIIDPDSMIIN